VYENKELYGGLYTRSRRPELERLTEAENFLSCDTLKFP
jgi:hypothetical protein